MPLRIRKAVSAWLLALGVAGAVADCETLIEDAEAVGISYPGFWQELERLTAHLAEGGQK